MSARATAVYFTRTERTVYVLLTEATNPRNRKDIARAKIMARAIRENKQMPKTVCAFRRRRLTSIVTRRSPNI